MKPKASNTQVRLAVDVVEQLGDWMTANGHTSPTAATNAALRQFLKGYSTNTPTQAVTAPVEAHSPVRKLQQIPQSSEPDNFLNSAFSDLLSE